MGRHNLGVSPDRDYNLIVACETCDWEQLIDTDDVNGGVLLVSFLADLEDQHNEDVK